MMARQSSPAMLRALATITSVGLVLSACGGAGSEGGDSVGDGGPAEPTSGGVPFGASIEEYQAAFADVEPITVRIQTSGAAGAVDNGGKQAYGDALEEYSGGKITIEWGYGNSFVPAATEQAFGYADGRHDLGNFQPYYNPDVFPLLADLANATFLDGNLPTGTLVSSGWLTEVVYAVPEYQEEAQENGIHILAAAPSSNLAAIFCTEPRTSLADFSGTAVSASGAGRVAQLSSLGASPQSIAFTELYEALQRGVADCGSTTATAIDTMGGIDLVPHAVADPEAALVGFPVFLAVGKERWDSLPVVAQQLLFDLVGVYLDQEPKAQSTRNVNWLEQARAAGGGIQHFDGDARAAMLETNGQLLDEIAARGSDTDAFVAARDRWSGIVNDELYPDITEDLEEFLADGAFPEVDLQPFVDRIYEDLLLEHRPN